MHLLILMWESWQDRSCFTRSELLGLQLWYWYATLLRLRNTHIIVVITIVVVVEERDGSGTWLSQKSATHCITTTIYACCATTNTNHLAIQAPLLVYHLLEKTNTFFGWCPLILIYLLLLLLKIAIIIHKFIFLIRRLLWRWDGMVLLLLLATTVVYDVCSIGSNVHIVVLLLELYWIATTKRKRWLLRCCRVIDRWRIASLFVARKDICFIRWTWSTANALCCHIIMLRYDRLWLLLVLRCWLLTIVIGAHECDIYTSIHIEAITATAYRRWCHWISWLLFNGLELSLLPLSATLVTILLLFIQKLNLLVLRFGVNLFIASNANSIAVKISPHIWAIVDHWWGIVVIYVVITALGYLIQGLFIHGDCVFKVEIIVIGRSSRHYLLSAVLRRRLNRLTGFHSDEIISI